MKDYQVEGALIMTQVHQKDVSFVKNELNKSDSNVI